MVNVAVWRVHQPVRVPVWLAVLSSPLQGVCLGQADCLVAVSDKGVLACDVLSHDFAVHGTTCVTVTPVTLMVQCNGLAATLSAGGQEGGVDVSEGSLLSSMGLKATCS